ncbi:MAG: outer membrane lipoprotein chaperone LolA [Cellvibrionaceae bacterium]
MKNFFIVLLGSFIGFFVEASEPNNSASDRLLTLLKPLSTLSGDFTQKVTDATGKVIQSSDGKFALSRPGLLRWETIQPFPQLLTINEETIWIYDPDLEQATRRKVGDDVKNSPALLLTSDASAMIDRYDITEVVGTDGIQVFSLQPKKTEMGITHFNLVFRESSPSRIELKDSLGQQTLIELAAMETNEKLPLEYFSFEPPEGTDVLSDGSN